MSVTGAKGGKRASMAFLFTTSVLLVVLVSLSFPFPADAFGRTPNFKLKSPSPPKKPIHMPSTPPKKFPPSPPKKPIHYEPSKPPKKPVKPINPKSSPPPYKEDHMPSTIFTTVKTGFNPWKVAGKGYETYDRYHKPLGYAFLSPPEVHSPPWKPRLRDNSLDPYKLRRPPPMRLPPPSPNEALRKAIQRRLSPPS